MTRKVRRSIERDCIALLEYVYQHRDEPQSYTHLSRATGIPRMSLTQLIRWATTVEKKGRTYTVCGISCSHPHAVTDWALYNYGIKYGYRVKFIGERGRIIDVDKVPLRDYIPDYYPEDSLTLSEKRQQQTMLGGGPVGREDRANLAARLLGDFGEFTWNKSNSERFLSTVSDSNPASLYALIVTATWYRRGVASSAHPADGVYASSRSSS